jgi:SAM-dependent methyltransferase
MTAPNLPALLIRLVGREAFFIHYYRIFYWCVRRLGLGTAFNYGYSPRSKATTPDGPDAEPYQMEMYHQAALQVGEEGLRGRRVLEISCGMGGGLDYLKRRGGIGYAVALDRSFIAASLARLRFGLSALTGDARRLPFADRSFDVVVNVEASHLYFGDDFVKELARVLAPGGSVLMTDFRYGTPAECEQALRDVFGKADFDVVQFRDTTSNVVAACEADTVRRESLLATVPWPLRSLGRRWIGTERSDDYLDLRAGRSMYFILAARLRGLSLPAEQVRLSPHAAPPS